MANIGTPNFVGPTQQILGIAGVLDNDIVLEQENLERYNEFTLSSSAGAMDVDVSLDGTNFTAALALTDLESLAPATRVIVTVAAGIFQFTGTFKHIRIRQNGATAVANAVLYCGQAGRG